jgi:hypothetical protein
MDWQSVLGKRKLKTSKQGRGAAIDILRAIVGHSCLIRWIIMDATGPWPPNRAWAYRGRAIAEPVDTHA